MEQWEENPSDDERHMLGNLPVKTEPQDDNDVEQSELCRPHMRHERFEETPERRVLRPEPMFFESELEQPVDYSSQQNGRSSVYPVWLVKRGGEAMSLDTFRNLSPTNDAGEDHEGFSSPRTDSSGNEVYLDNAHDDQELSHSTAADVKEARSGPSEPRCTARRSLHAQTPGVVNSRQAFQNHLKVKFVRKRKRGVARAASEVAVKQELTSVTPVELLSTHDHNKAGKFSPTISRNCSPEKTDENSAAKSKADKRKLNVLSLQKKIELIKTVEKGGKKRKDVAQEYGIANSTLTGILNDKEKLKKQYYEGEMDVTKQRFRRANHKDVEIALLMWLKCARAADMPVTGSAMFSKADEIARELGKSEWHCNDGWLSRFKKRHGISCTRITKKRQCLQPRLSGSWCEEVLKPKLREYKPQDVFSIVECGLFWRTLPDRTASFQNEACLGGERSRDRLTVMVCSNMDFSEKQPLLTVGQLARPRCLKGTEQSPVLYEVTAKAWMTSKVFENWLQSFDQEVQSQHRKVLLVLDSCPAHLKVGKLKATEVLFVPTNTAWKLHPCSEDVVRNLKVYYRTLLVSKVLEHLDSGSAYDDFELSLLDAFFMLEEAWDKITLAKVAHSFSQANFVTASPLAGDLKLETSGYDSALLALGALLTRLCLYREVNISAADVVNIDRHVATSVAGPNSVGVVPPPFPLTDAGDSETETKSATELLSSSPSTAPLLSSSTSFSSYFTAPLSTTFSSSSAKPLSSSSTTPLSSSSTTLLSGSSSTTLITASSATTPHPASSSTKPSSSPCPMPLPSSSPCGKDEQSPMSLLEAMAAVNKVELFLTRAGCSEVVLSPFQEFKNAFDLYIERAHASSADQHQ